MTKFIINKKRYIDNTYRDAHMGETTFGCVTRSWKPYLVGIGRSNDPMLRDLRRRYDITDWLDVWGMAWIWEVHRSLSPLCVATRNVWAKLKTEILRHTLVICLTICRQSSFPFPWWWVSGECYRGMLILRLLIVPWWERIQCTLWWI